MLADSKTIDLHGAALSRRGFLATGGALVVALGLKPGMALAADGATRDAMQLASWIEIHADNTVLVRTGKCDFGQSSIYTAYRQIIAEELCVPLAAMTTVISGDTDRTPDGGGTFGLLRNATNNMRKVAAFTREALLELAAIRFGAAKSSLTIKDGVISGGGKSVTLGELVNGQDFKLTIPVTGELLSPFGLRVDGNPPLKPVADYTIVGQPVKNPSLRPKFSGQALWVGDVRLPGMAHARTVHPATLGSTLVSAGKVDSARFPGAKTVVIGNLLAVVSDNEWEAVQAAQQVAGETKWSDWKGLPSSEKLFDHLHKKVDWTVFPARKGRFNKGDIASKADAKVLQASYNMPYHKHAPIGPMVSLADVRPDGSVTLHTHSQNAQHLRRMIARMLGDSEAKVVVRTYPGPGHFGRSNGGSAGSEDEAVLLSRELGRPVRVQWMRADDMQWSSQSPASVSDIRITLDNAGRIATYQAGHRGPPMQDDRLIGAVLAGLPVIDAPGPDVSYGFQNGLMNVADTWVYGAVANVEEQGFGTYQVGQKESPIAVGLRDHSMRTPIQFQQNFPRETAMNEAAALAGIDPIEFRLNHVDSPRFKAVLIPVVLRRMVRQLGMHREIEAVTGTGISMLIGITVTVVSAIIGIVLGVLGGFLGGRVDDAVLFAITTRLSIPVVLVALAVVGLLGSLTGGGIKEGFNRAGCTSSLLGAMLEVHLSQVSVRRGSITTIFIVGRARFAASRRWNNTGWHQARLLPTSTTRSASSKSS